MLENIFFINMILNILVQLIINYRQTNDLQWVFLLVQKYLLILLFIKIILQRPNISNLRFLIPFYKIVSKI